MDPNSGKLYESLAAAHLAGVTDAVEVIGTPEAVQRLSAAVRADLNSIPEPDVTTEWFAVNDQLDKHIRVLRAGVDDPWVQYDFWLARERA